MEGSEWGAWSWPFSSLLPRHLGLRPQLVGGGEEAEEKSEIGAMAFGGGLGLAINEVMDFILIPAVDEEDDDASISKKKINNQIKILCTIKNS